MRTCAVIPAATTLALSLAACLAAADGAPAKRPAAPALAERPGDLIPERDRLMVEAGAKMVKGLRELAATSARLASLLPADLGAGTGPGCIRIVVESPASVPPEDPKRLVSAERVELRVVLLPEDAPVEGRDYPVLFKTLRLKGETIARADDPALDAAVQKLVSNALDPVRDLDRVGVPWGPAVDGVQVRLVASHTDQWGRETYPLLRVEARNQGPRDLVLCATGASVNVQVDGWWYARRLPPEASPEKTTPFPPGAQISGLVWSVPGWRDDLDAVAFSRRPGKHALRVSVLARPAADGGAAALRVESNLVEADILTTHRSEADALKNTPPHYSNRSGIILEYGGFTSDAVFAVVAKASQEEDTGMLDTVARALGGTPLARAHPDETLEVLARLSGERSPLVAGSAARSLGLNGDRRALPILRKNATRAPVAFSEAVVRLGEQVDPEWLVPFIRAKTGYLEWEKAMDLIANCSGPKAAPALVRCLDDDASLGNTYNRRLVSWIGACGGPKLVYEIRTGEPPRPELVKHNEDVIRQIKAWAATLGPAGVPGAVARIPPPPARELVADIPWGPETEGMQLRFDLIGVPLRGDSVTGRLLGASIRNRGTRSFWAEGQNAVELEVDGAWYRLVRKAGEPEAVRCRIDPARRVETSVLIAGRPGWEAISAPGPLKITPGPHTLRLALFVQPADDPHALPVRVVSAPVVVPSLP